MAQNARGAGLGAQPGIVSDILNLKRINMKMANKILGMGPNSQVKWEMWALSARQCPFKFREGDGGMCVESAGRAELGRRPTFRGGEKAASPGNVLRTREHRGPGRGWRPKAGPRGDR